MADPAGATNYIKITSDNTKLAASMPDVGNTFAADLVIDQAAAVNYEGGAETFIDGLATQGTSTLRVYNSDVSIEVPFGIKQFSQVAGSRKLILGLGIPSTAPLLSSAPVTYRLYRGCTGGTFEAKSSVVPAAEGFAGYWPSEESSGTVYDWTSNANNGTNYGTTTTPGLVGAARAYDRAASQYLDCGNGASLALTTFSTFTVVKPTALDNYPVILCRGENLLRNYALIIDTSGKPYIGFRATNDTWASVVSSVVLVPGQWYRIATAYDGANLSICVNGTIDSVAETRTPVLPTTPNNRLSLGRLGTYDANYYAGAIDEASVASLGRSTNWMLAWDAMLGNNGAFWTVGAEQACGGLVLPRRFNAGFNAQLNPGVN